MILTLNQFLGLQTELFHAFGWFIRWWLIMFAVAGIVTSTILAVLLTTRSSMIDKT